MSAPESAPAGQPEPGLPGGLLAPVRSGNAFEETTAHLLGLIRLGRVAVGDRLPSERDLAMRLGVSRSTLRDAIAELRQAGFLEVRRGRYGGAFVTDRVASGALPAPTMFSAEELEDVLRFRAILETSAAREAALAGVSPALAGALRASVSDCRAADASDFRRLDSRLHLLIAEASGIPSLLQACAETRGRLNALLDRIPLLRINLDHCHDQHAELMEAVIAGDAESSAEIAAEHADGTASLLRGFLSEALGDPGLRRP